ncbi:segregation/condensation protein A [Candidatus Bipolaricaulota bacterium]|nr:segregation/condensation protein A [Candidatus Bipolaricaulota bacterium]
METVRVAEIPIEELIGETWEGVLTQLTSDMDPWNIDLSELARRYRAYLRALQENDFEVSGRMVVTCSVLLRMKSDELLAMEYRTDRDGLVAELEEAIEQEEFLWEEPPNPEEFSLPVLRRPRRQVTLGDLRTALTSALKVSRRRAERLLDYVEVEDFDPFESFEIGGIDFSDRLHSLLSKIKGFLSGRRVLSFFRLLEKGDKEERVQRFFEILHLAASGEIECSQSEFLGDITIKLEAAD